METPRLGASAGLARRFLAAPVQPRTYLELVYLLLAFPLGMLYLLVLGVGLTVGLSLAVFVVGLPIVALTLALGLVLAEGERRLAGLLLRREVTGRDAVGGEGWWGTTKALLLDPRAWTPLVYLPAKILPGLATVIVVVVTFSTGVSLLFMPLYYADPAVYVGLPPQRPVEIHPVLTVGWNNLLVGVDAVVELSYWRVETLPQAMLVSAGGLVVCWFGFVLIDLLAAGAGWMTDLLLGGGYDPSSLLRSEAGEGDGAGTEAAT